MPDLEWEFRVVKSVRSRLAVISDMLAVISDLSWITLMLGLVGTVGILALVVLGITAAIVNR